MKNLAVIILALCSFGIANAQVVVENDYEGSLITTNENNTTSSKNGTSMAEESSNLLNSIDISYQAIDNGFGLGWTGIINNFMFNVSWLSGDTDKYVTKNSGWRAGIGGNYRYWLTNFLYAEGSAGVEYSHYSVEYKVDNKTSKESDGDFGLFVTPRIGVKLFKIANDYYGIVAGYRWDFNKFKFKKENTDDYFTIGFIGYF